MNFNTKLLRQALTSITFKDFLWVILFSLFAGHYLVSHQEAEYFWELWMMRSYYSAMLGSFMIAFCLCFVICYIDCCLNLVWLWMEYFYVRLLRQVQFGVVLPMCLLPLLVWTYFSLRGEPLDFVEYIRVDFGISAILIVLLNVFYVCRYFFELLKIYYQPVGEQFLHVEEEEAKEANVEKEEEKEVPPLLESAVDIRGLYKMVYFYHSDRVNWAINRLGEMKDAGLLMEELEALLPKSDFFRVQPGFIVHRKSITKPMKASSNRLLLYLNTAYHKALPFTEIKGKKKNYVAVSQRKVGAFRKWYEEK